MAATAYPRDLVGYGRKPPHARWPGDARIALQFVINYEEGGESCILHGDAASEAFLSEIVGATAWPGQRHMNMESIYEFGSRAGYWRLHRMFTERGLPVTVFAVASAMARHPDIVASMNEAGWEIASHGLKWIEYKDFAKADEAAHIHEAIRIHSEIAGARPLGFYQGRCSANTLALTMEEQGFLYSADSYADELPYWVDGPHGPQLIVPYTLDANDMRFATPQGFNSGRSVLCLPEGQFRRALRRRRRGAEDDVDRPALPSRRPPRTRGRPCPLSRLRAGPRQGLGGDAPRYCAPLDQDPPASRRVRSEPDAARPVRRALRRRLRAHAADRRPGPSRRAVRGARHGRRPARRAHARRAGDDARREARTDQGASRASPVARPPQAP